MPTFNALGVTATLSVASLRSSVSSSINLRQGKQQQADARRIDATFDQGRNLPERPIGADGSDRGVMQSIGDNQDMTFFMVLAGDAVRTVAHSIARRDQDASSHPSEPLSSLTSFETDNSPLTPLFGVMPGDAMPLLQSDEAAPVYPPASAKFDIKTTKQTDKNTKRVRRKIKSKGNTSSVTEREENEAPSSYMTLEQARPFLDDAAGPFALALTLKFDSKTFLRENTEARHGKDLKFEIFLNGKLVDVVFISNRRSGGEVAKHGGFERFSGIRFHRQTEKPWVYWPTINTAHGDALSAEQRWAGTSLALFTEAEQRGKDALNDRPVSANFLISLSELQMPCTVKVMGDKMAILDVVITAGNGKKYGPETPYIREPTRLADADFVVAGADMASNIAGPLPSFTQDVMVTDTPCTPKRPQLPYFLQTSSPEVPLKKQTVRSQPSPAPKFNYDLLDRKMLGNYENAHGKIKSGRTLKQRLADMDKMTPKRRQKTWADMQADLDDGTLSAIKEAIVHEAVSEPPIQKKPAHFPALSPALPAAMPTALKPALDPELDPRLGGLEEAMDLSPDRHMMGETIDPRKLMSFDQSEPLPNLTDPEAMLAQERVDIAFDYGAPSDGRLLRQIMSLSPQHTPPKRSKALNLANSPMPPPKRRSSAKLDPVTPPKRRRHTRASSPIQSGPNIEFRTPQYTSKADAEIQRTQRSNRGSNRTKQRWDPTESTINDELRSFQIPDLCKDSVVSYAEGDLQRQIIKARNGEFKEESLIVGMRFVVI